MLEFTLGDHLYRARKLDTFKQMHVLRRVGPALLQLQELRDAVADGSAGDTLSQIGIFLKALHAMSDEECDFVVKTCMAAVQRQQGSNGGGTWASVLDARSGLIMFEDLHLLAIFDITGRVLMDNLSGFFSINNPVTGPPAATPEPSNLSNMTTGI